jgi:hypothetical protein
MVRIDEHGGFLLAVGRVGVLPGLARVGGLVQAVAGEEVRPLEALAAANVEDVRVGRGDGESADGAGQMSSKMGLQRRPWSVLFQTPSLLRPSPDSWNH